MSKERPIIFSAPMVRATLREKNPKTQTRRIIKPQPVAGAHWNAVVVSGHGGWTDGHGSPLRCPYGAPGDRLWVRENWRPLMDHLSECTGPKDIRFAASVSEAEWAISTWRPSIHMPRWACRILLEVTEIRAHRLADIHTEDAVAEGWPGASAGAGEPTAWFFSLWESINGKGSWDRNDWVWAISFRRVNVQS